MLFHATLAIAATLLLLAAWMRVANLILPVGGHLNNSGGAFVDSWGQNPTDDTLNSVRVGGIGAASFGKKLRVKIVGRDGRSVLDTLTWEISGQLSPDLDLHALARRIEDFGLRAVGDVHGTRGEHHGIRKPSFQQDRFQRFLDWYDLHVKGDAGATVEAAAGGKVAE